jgi:diacylglycerol O-acyltransferase / wax synthase
MPRFRQHLSVPTTGGLTWPSWLPDETFDIARTFRRAALPSPGSETELREWAAEFWSHRLERSSRCGRWCSSKDSTRVVGRSRSKTHHCMVDGVGSVDVTHLLLDASPEPVQRDLPDDVTELARARRKVPEVATDGERPGASGDPAQCRFLAAVEVP